jgi:predicted nucleotidyltransferase/polyhydroxyalkanoate synthesis regulator phasin
MLPTPSALNGSKSSPPPQLNLEALKGKLETFKKEVLKKYTSTLALVLLPPQASVLIEEDELLPKEVVETKPLHVMVIIPEDDFKHIPKIKPVLIELAKKTKENLWIHLKTPVDVFNYGLDSKFDLVDAVAQGYPIADNGFLGALRMASIHKTLVLRKFDRYIASYVIGGSLVRGTAGKDSDVDCFVVIDDTDVKRMNRVELLERLRGIIHEYIKEATALAGVKNLLNVQVWLLTDFWQRVKDAEPVAFTFIRDGIPLYDRGTFIPWKLLLRMGRIKPSPEAIDMYVKQGDQTRDFIKRRLLDAMVDIYYGVVTPTQAMMMLAGEAPPVPKTLVTEVKQVLFTREKVLSHADLKLVEKAVHLFKQYEYGKLKEFSGTQVDLFLKECLAYNARLIGVRKKLEQRMHEKSAAELYAQVFKLLETFFGKGTPARHVAKFDKDLVKKGKLSPRYTKVLQNLVSAQNKIASGKLTAKEVDNVKKDAYELIAALTEYAQRADLVSAEKGMMRILYQGRKAELVLLGNQNFIIEGRNIQEIKQGKLVSSTKEAFEKALSENKGKLSTKVSGSLFKTLEQALGSFELEL